MLNVGSTEFAFYLATLRKLSPGRARLLIAEAANVPGAEALEFLGARDWEFPFPTERDEDNARRAVEAHVAEGVSIIPISSARYPGALAGISDAPPILYAKGNEALLANDQCLAVVGTRKASPAGLKAASRISDHFARRGWCIVSGLALGIDAAAHEAALDAKGATIAVLAHGLHTATPPRNKPLAERILAQGGLWVSEHPLRRPPLAAQFKARNRIQTGLSVGSIIVEGEERSGSMAQARFCQDQGRELFAVVPQTPSNSLHLVSAGTEWLVRSHAATPIRSKDDYTVVQNQLDRALMKRRSHASLF